MPLLFSVLNSQSCLLPKPQLQDCKNTFLHTSVPNPCGGTSCTGPFGGRAPAPGGPTIICRLKAQGGFPRSFTDWEWWPSHPGPPAASQASWVGQAASCASLAFQKPMKPSPKINNQVLNPVTQSVPLLAAWCCMHINQNNLKFQTKQPKTSNSCGFFLRDSAGNSVVLPTTVATEWPKLSWALFFLPTVTFPTFFFENLVGNS